MNVELLVSKNSIKITKLRQTPELPLLDNQIRVQIDIFSLTANNITYAIIGDGLKYWDLFPSGTPDWGIVPVWGFGSVIQSNHPQIVVGERLYGLWPMAASIVLKPSHVTKSTLIEGSAHRAKFNIGYNQFLRCAQDLAYKVEHEEIYAIMKPLAATAWMLDSFFLDNGFFGANTILLSSASSKTAFATAFYLNKHKGVEVIGLTSKNNQEFCKHLGCYHQIFTYDFLSQINSKIDCAYLDFAGSLKLTTDIHNHFDRLKYDCRIGFTHGEEFKKSQYTKGPPSTFFFAPTQIENFRSKWGNDELERRRLKAWSEILQWLTSSKKQKILVKHHFHPVEIEQIYFDLVTGHADPKEGHILSFSKK